MNTKTRLALSAWVALAGASWAGSPSSAAATNPVIARKAYTNKTTINVPIRMSEADRTAIKSVKCYVKPAGGTWALNATGNASTNKFIYQAPGDGEYLFCFATEDHHGNVAPANPDAVPPALVVIVDTKPPELVVQPLAVASGQTFVQCTLRDANPESESIIAEGPTADGQWRPLIALGKQMPGLFRCPESGLPPKLRVTGRDKAGNVATLKVALSASAAGAPLEQVVASKSTPSAAPPAAPPMANESPVVPEPVHPIAPALSAPAAPTLPAPVAPPAVETHVAEKPAPAPAAPNTGLATRQMINSTRCNLAYTVEGISATAAARVEAFVTRNDGRTWERLADDSNRSSPIELSLPGEGLYGLALIVSTSAQPSAAPAPGEAPDYWVEVDTTAPEVKLENTQPGVGDDAGTLFLHWTVRDRNLAPDAVDVAWSPQLDGPWSTIAKGLRADGQYRWPVPREAMGRVYLKIEAADRAGNVGRFVTPSPVATEGPRPRVRVLGINPAAVR